MLDGNGLGIQTSDDIEFAFDTLESSIHQRTGGIEFNARTAKVKRLDVNADFLIGEERIRSYINAVPRRLPRMIPGTVGETTAQHHNGSHTIITYGKYAEMQKQFRQGAATQKDVDAAAGLLRIEDRLTKNSPSRLATKLNVDFEAQYLITLPIANQIIGKTLTQLGFDKPKVSPYQRDQKLFNHFKPGEALKMFGFLEWRERYGEDSLKTLMSSSTYHRLRNKLRDAGLWDISPSGELPALTICDVYNNYTQLPPMGIETAGIPLDTPSIM